MLQTKVDCNWQSQMDWPTGALIPSCTGFLSYEIIFCIMCLRIVSRVLEVNWIKRSKLKVEKIALLKMIILQAFKSLERLMDFDAFHRHDRTFSIRAAYVTWAVVSWVCMCFVDLILNIHDFRGAAMSMNLLCGIWLTVPLYWRLLINHDRCISLLDDFQVIVNDRTFNAIQAFEWI